MTQKDLADQLGVDRVTVTYWANQRSTPSFENIRKLLALGFDINRLLRPPRQLTDDEAAVVELFGRIPEESRPAFLTMARSLAAPDRRRRCAPPSGIEDRRRFAFGASSNTDDR